MHAIVPSSIPLPVAQVRNPDREFVGYILEYVAGRDVQRAAPDGDARRGEAAARPRARSGGEGSTAKNVVHGDLNPWNVVVADDGRTVLLDPVPFAKPAARRSRTSSASTR